VIDFQDGDAVLVIDVFNDFEHDDGSALLASFEERVTQMRAVLSAARAADVPVIYVNDERGRWESDAPALIRAALDGEGEEAVRQVLPEPGDSVLLKHRYSAFDHTALDLLLASLETERVLLVGAATEGCVVQTAIDARERDLKATIVADACATTDARLEETALRYAEEVGGIRVWRAGRGAREPSS
jgi:nicotinamidase-related amidase